MRGPDQDAAARSFFVWGLKRSGIHLVVGWLYANAGGEVEEALTTSGLHPQLCDGFADPAAQVTFFNNCGRFHSRRYELGALGRDDFVAATGSRGVTIFGIEDCSLRFASQTIGIRGSTHLLVLRDPLNNLASRVEAAKARPEVFPVDEAYLDLFDAYCAEALGRTAHLSPKVVVTFNRFVQDRGCRDDLAGRLGLPNRDVVSEVSPYGGGSSFSGAERSPSAALMTRYRDHPLPPALVESLLRRDSIREAAAVLFGYDLAREAAGT